jgi:Zn-dependent protease
LSLGGRLGAWRRRLDTPQLITVLAVVGIVIIALVAGVKRGYISSEKAIFFAVFVPSVIMHEVSHGIVALWCGDDTAKRAGRLTANPLKHIDPIGSLVVPVVMELTTGIPFGWAKPVPVSVNGLRHPRNQIVLVSVAGPLSNYLLATLAGVGLHFVISAHPFATGAWFWFAETLFELGIVNVIIGTFNLLPIPPLDGSAFVERLLPVSALPTYYRMRMGFMIVVFAVVLLDQNAFGSFYQHLENWYSSIFIPQ